MLRILVTFALETEFAPWRALRKFRRSMWGTAEAYFAEVGGAEVGVVLTGVGSRQAALAVSKVSWGEPDTMQFCISSGLAGALKPDYQVGQVLAARMVVAESAPEGSSGRIVESSAALTSFAADCGATVVEKFYSAERAIATAERSNISARAPMRWRWKASRFFSRPERTASRLLRFERSVTRWTKICRSI